MSDAITAARYRRNGNTRARMSAALPRQDVLRDRIHLENIEVAAADFQNSEPFRKVVQNFEDAAAAPDWSLSHVFLRLPCKKGAAARHLIYAGQRRRLDRIGPGLQGPFWCLISRRLFHEA